MKKIHLILQGKGGVGKSLVASLFMQYLMKLKYQVKAIDTDPVNNTLKAYKDLDVTLLGIWKDLRVDSSKFDEINDFIERTPENHHIIIDNGASGFVPLLSYLLDNETLSLWESLNTEVVFHTVITGGQAYNDTISGLGQIHEFFPNQKIIIWKNRYFGEIYDKSAGKEFEQFELFKSLQKKGLVLALIELPSRTEGTYGIDLKEMLSRHQTFAAADKDANLSISTRQRLRIWWRDAILSINGCRVRITANTFPVTEIVQSVQTEEKPASGEGNHVNEQEQEEHESSKMDCAVEGKKDEHENGGTEASSEHHEDIDTDGNQDDTITKNKKKKMKYRRFAELTAKFDTGELTEEEEK